MPRKTNKPANTPKAHINMKYDGTYEVVLDAKFGTFDEAHALIQKLQNAGVAVLRDTADTWD